MAQQATSGVVDEYVHVLRGFGLAPERIRELHGISGGDLDLEAIERSDVIESRGGEITVEDLRQQLPVTLARSDIGIDAPRRYWNELPTMQLRRVIETYGGAFAVEPSSVDERTAQAPIRGSTTVQVTDTGSDGYRRTRFSYPDTALGDDNYPALLGTINETIFKGTDLRFVHLEHPEDCWRFALVDERRLSDLQSELGRRVRWAGEPLLGEHQPEAYDRNVTVDSPVTPSIPSSLVPADDDDGTKSLTRRNRPDFEQIRAEVSAELTGDANGRDTADGPTGAQAPVADGTFEHGDDAGPSVDDLVAADDPTAVVDGGTTARDGTAAPAPEIEADDGDLSALFASIGETDPDFTSPPTPDAPDSPSVGDTGSQTNGADDEWETNGADDEWETNNPDDEWETNNPDVGWTTDTTTLAWESTGDADRGPGSRTGSASEHALDEAFASMSREAARMPAVDTTDGDDDRVTSGEIIEALEHENAASSASVEAGFIWLDPDELTPVPEAVYEAAMPTM